MLHRDVCDGVWHHVSAMVDGGVAQVMVDGLSSPPSNVLLGAGTNASLHNNDFLVVGSDDQTTGFHSFQGFLSEVSTA